MLVCFEGLEAGIGFDTNTLTQNQTKEAVPIKG